LGCFTPEEIAVVRGAIACHGTKEEYDGEVDELLKDADVLQHYLYNPALSVKSRGSSQVFPAKSAAWALRMRRVFGELGLGQSAVVDEQKAY